MLNVNGKPMPPNVYEANDTMRLLGYQYPISILSTAGGGNAQKQIDEIAQARPYTFTYEAAIDLFILGYIYGKQDERKRKKKARI